MAGHDAIEYALFRPTRPVLAGGFAYDSASGAAYKIARFRLDAPLDNCCRIRPHPAPAFLPLRVPAVLLTGAGSI